MRERKSRRRIQILRTELLSREVNPAVLKKEKKKINNISSFHATKTLNMPSAMKRHDIDTSTIVSIYILLAIDSSIHPSFLSFTCMYPLGAFVYKNIKI